MKATPIPDSIDRRPGGIDKASCGLCGSRITRSVALGQSLPWWHIDTMLIYCTELGGKTK